MNAFAEAGDLKNASCDCSVNFHDPLIVKHSCQAPHLADLLTSTFLVEQRTDIHELRKLRGQLLHFSIGTDPLQAEIMFDRLILDE